MRRSGITGVSGLVGWHLRGLIRSLGNPDTEPLLVDRETFSDIEALRQFVRGVEIIIHLAGMNRGGEQEIEQTNIRLTEQIIKACEAEMASPHVIFANSTHYDRDTAYGRSKQRSAQLLQKWAQRSGAKFTNLIIPGVFGERGRPFYNSVVSTFCYQLANRENPQLVDDKEIELIHAQDLADRIVTIAERGEEGEVRVCGHVAKVSDLLRKLSAMNEQYRRQVLPGIEDRFDLALFNTYRSYLFPKYYPVHLSSRADNRGALVEAVKTVHGGQCFISTTHSGFTRGNHYHRQKVERFLVLRGRARIRIRPLFSREITTFDVDGEHPGYVDIPTLHTHNITNTGTEDAVTLFWANEIFDANRPDTYAEAVDA